MEKKNVLVYLSSFILLLISFCMFIYAFSYVTVISHYVYSGLFLLLFCIVNKMTEKKIMCKDGYNLLQAYLFYEKCRKNGVRSSPQKLKKSDKVLIIELAKAYDYCKDFTDEQVVELYSQGRSVINSEEKTKKERIK